MEEGSITESGTRTCEENDAGQGSYEFVSSMVGDLEIWAFGVHVFPGYTHAFMRIGER
jgi:hypothetical protein